MRPFSQVAQDRSKGAQVVNGNPLAYAEPRKRRAPFYVVRGQGGWMVRERWSGELVTWHSGRAQARLMAAARNLNAPSR